MPAASTENSFKRTLIAPCGMNCGVCIAHVRIKNRCMGCMSAGAEKAHHCSQCYIKNCTELKSSGTAYCFDCKSFPCRRLRQLDERYRSKYGMSMIENLISIKENGIRKFLAAENARWKCTHCGNIVSVHRPNCLVCGIRR